MRPILTLLLALLLVQAASAAEAPPKEPPPYPEGLQPMNEGEMRQLMDGQTFEFRVYEIPQTASDVLAGLNFLAGDAMPGGAGPLTGTATWHLMEMQVEGTFVLGKEKPESFSAEWFIQNERSCTRFSGHSANCWALFPYLDGFMETTADGDVHAVYLPKE